MKVSAFRIAKKKHASTAFSGEGARLAGARWNSPGVAVVYGSATLSLAALELLVHIDSPAILEHYVAFEFQFDDTLLETAKPLPNNWKVEPPPASTQRIGDRWVDELRSVALRVPSAVIPEEFNYVLNPEHPDFSRIEIGRAKRFRFVHRLF